MAKKSKIVYIIGSIVIGIAALLIIFFVLIGSGVMDVRQKKIAFASASEMFTYDGEQHTNDSWEIVSGELRSGHTAIVDVTGSQTDVGESLNYLTVTILDGGGADVTGNYEIEYQPGTLTVTQKELTITASSVTRQYDGTPLSSADYTVDGEVGTNQKLSVTVSGEITNVGTTPNRLYATICDEQGVDKSNNYALTLVEGTLTVTARKIGLTSEDGDKTYDGKYFEYEKWAITDGSLADGQEIAVTFANNMLNAGTGKNTFSAVITDGDNDVTGNYDIDYTFGKLTINKVSFSMSTGSDTKLYDGTPLTKDECNYSEAFLVSGQSIVVYVTGIQTEIGTSSNTVDYKICDSDGNDTTKNYYINLTEGTLTVNQRAFSLSTGSAEKYYDGTPLKNDEYEILESDLLDGHTCTITVTGSQTLAGKSKNSAIVRIKDINGNDVTGYYDVQLTAGSLTVIKAPLSISTEGAIKVYDGTPLTDSNWAVDSADMLQNGDTITEVLMPATITNVDSVDNYVASITIMNDDTDVTINYNITYHVGTLTITPRPITVRSGTASKDYDGQPLTCGDYDIVSITQPVATHTIQVAISGYIVEVGETDNTIAQVLITDENDVDVTDNYEIEYQEGTLTVKGYGSGSGDIDLTGDIGGGSGGDTGNDSEVALSLYSENNTENVYMRLASYGDYTGKNWRQAKAYSGRLDSAYSLNYYTGLVLNNLGYTSSQIQIKVNGTYYYLPYYMDMLTSGDYTVQSSDIMYTGNSTEYSLNYYSYIYVQNPYVASDLQYVVSKLSTRYTSAEESYRKFVYANYLQISDTTKAYFDEYLAGKFDATSRYVVGDVASYIQGAAEYNLDYDTSMDEQEDVVVAFLSEYKQGVCRHYASSATMLFRYLGIPARYVVGYLGNVVAGEWTDITTEKAHAWTEVYIDGIGWVQVEVTGGGLGDSGNGGGSDDSNIKYEYNFKPTDEYMKYTDGTQTLTHSQTLQGFSELSKLGYTYSVKISGSRKIPGITESKIESLTIYDKDGNDVTSSINYKLSTGKLQVYIAELNVTTQGAAKVYDGAALTCKQYTVSSLLSGHSFASFEVLGSVTDVGSMLNKVSYKIQDSNGSDVTDYYKFNATYGKLEVTPRDLTITSSDATKAFDGTPLTCDEYTLGDGTSVVDGQQLIVEITGQQSGIGRSDNTIKSVEILDADGKDVTSNYNITTKNGTLRVTYAG